MAGGKGKDKGGKAGGDSGKDGGEFKSFADLLRSRGGEPAPPPPAAGERGWTVAGQEEAFGEDALDTLPDVGAGALSRVAARPASNGPMETGPPCYRDENSEEVGLLRSFRVRTRFPEDVLREVQNLPADPRPEDGQGRADLRGQTIFTIDGDDAKDYDDAIAIRELGGGAVEVSVHIADVSHYVRPETRLDDEALARGTSVYLADQVVPMLPEALSNGLCSLVPDRDRLAFSVHMQFDKNGSRTAYRIEKSLIRSCRRLTYAKVQKLLDGQRDGDIAAIADLEGPLRLFETWTRRQQTIRDAKGSLRIQSRERKFVFGPDHEVQAIVDYPKYFSNTLIEETALAANQAVGDYFRERGLPTIYRVPRRRTRRRSSRSRTCWRSTASRFRARNSSPGAISAA
ncbi:MAG: RNB domain-containing ribonuclease [Planctomycetota bacterium]